jgi:sigma-B regulation protein RsbU (phosphoserine phosphatase)
MPIDKGNRNTLMAMLAIGLFVVFDIAGLSLNYLLSWRLEQQAVGINLAGRQRMLSQRMVKALLQIDNARRTGEPVKAYYDELKLSFDLFDTTLRGFDVGHETKGGAGEVMFLSPVAEPKARQVVAEAATLWKDYRSKVLSLLEAGENSDDATLQAALTEAKLRNLKLLGLMNTLTTELEMLTQQEAQRIRVYQGLALGLALLCCVLAFVLFRRRDAEIMEARQRATEAARADSDYVSGLVTHATESLQTAETLSTLAHQFFTALAPALGIGCASYYKVDDSGTVLEACGHYAQSGELSIPQRIALDEGLMGECAQAREIRMIVDPPGDYIKAMRVESGLMSASPRAIVLLPVVGNGVLLGMIEMALLQLLDARHETVLKMLLPLLAMRMEFIARLSRNETTS